MGLNVDIENLPVGLKFLEGGGEATRLILARDWTGHWLGQPETWPEALKVSLSLILNSPESMILSWGKEELTFFFNQTYFPMLGPRLSWAMGEPFTRVWADAWDQAKPIIDDAFAGRSVHFDDLPWVLDTDRGQRDTWWSFSYSRVLDGDGAVVGLFIFTNETTKRVLADRATDEARRETILETERQRLSLQQMPGFAAILAGAEHTFQYVNDAYAAISGQRDFVGRSVREVFPELAGQGFYELLDRAYSTGEAFSGREVPIRLMGEDEDRFIDLVYQPIHDDAGAVTGIFVGGYDITERIRAERRREALLVAGDRLRGVSSTTEAAEVAARILGETLSVSRSGFGQIDPGSGRFHILAQWTASGGNEVASGTLAADFPASFGRLASGEALVLDDIAQNGWLAGETELYTARGTQAMIAVPIVDRGRLVSVVFAHNSDVRHWAQDEVDFAHALADLLDATLRRLDAEANRTLLNRELGHRMKNQLALVQAVVNQTLRSAPDLTQARRSLGDRIAVLAHAHDVLIAGATGHSSVREIVRRALTLLDDTTNPRFHIDGPDLTVASRPALSLSLILHELSTNAAKYGALSVPTGEVTVTWGTSTDEGQSQFRLEWKESGGPEVTVPTTTGAGSKLIRAGLAGTIASSVSVEYQPQGLRCTIVAELSSFQTEPKD